MKVIYEDEFIICANKPNDTIVHHSYYSRNVIEEISLLENLYDLYGKVYPIHRLDRRTSGVVLLAKKTEFISSFQKLFTDNLIKKVYYGVVRGHSPDEITIDSPVKGRDSKVYKSAETYLKTIRNTTLPIAVKPYDTSRYSLVKLIPKTGRLHQLRIHLNKISYPLIGDTKYGDKNHNLMFYDNFGVSILFLHAYSLKFSHPYINKKMCLRACFNDDWVKVLKVF